MHTMVTRTRNRAAATPVVPAFGDVVFRPAPEGGVPR